MEEKRNRGKNFTESEKNFLFELVTGKYKKIIENKESDAVTIAKKNLAWQQIAKEFNSQNQTGHRTAKQLHALYDNLKKTARSNLHKDKQNAYKTGGDTFTPQSTMLDEKIVTVLKDQFLPPANKYDSSSSFIDNAQPSCSYSEGNIIIDNYDINEMDILIQDDDINDKLNLNENPSSPTHSVLPDIAPPSEILTPNAVRKRKCIGEKSTQISKKRKQCIDTLSSRFVQRKNFKDKQDEEIKEKKLEILNIEKEIKRKQLAVVEQQLEQDKKLYQLNLQNRLEEIEFERKIREIKLKNMNSKYN